MVSAMIASYIGRPLISINDRDRRACATGSGNTALILPGTRTRWASAPQEARSAGNIRPVRGWCRWQSAAPDGSARWAWWRERWIPLTYTADAQGRWTSLAYTAAGNRYEQMPYRRCGRSGVRLPEVSLGLWHNFGDEQPIATQRAILRRAFDLGITHFDLANNYGPPYGSAEINFGRIMREDLRPYRDELVISTKAGWDMWPGPYGDHGSRKYLLASLDQSLSRMGLEYVDIFYSHRFDPDTPLEETMGALDTAVRSGKALYAGISSYSAERTAEAAHILREMGVPLLIHQPSYSLLNRWIEGELLDTLGELGVGCICFS